MNYTPVADDVWHKQSPRELKFWRGWLKRHASEHVIAPPLCDYLRLLVNGSARIADLGAGACCLVGQREGIEIVASDALADEYAQMWADLGLAPEIPVARQDMTWLDYADGNFDIVHCANALDHSADPRAAVQEMARICKPGGMVYLMHIRDQARCAHYCGLHQWDVKVDGSISRRMPAGLEEKGRWSNERNGFALEDILPGAETCRAHRGTRVVTRWEKPYG